MELGTLHVEQYIALFLPFCTSTLNFCCEDLTYFFESLFFFDILRNSDCLQNCAFKDPLFSSADNATQLAASVPKVSYCTIECVSKQEGYVSITSTGSTYSLLRRFTDRSSRKYQLRQRYQDDKSGIPTGSEDDREMSIGENQKYDVPRANLQR